MYSFEPQSVDWPLAGRSAAGVDRLLRGFFRAELPDPWPAFRPPVNLTPRSVERTASRWDHAWGRFALAATVALLLLGHFLLGDGLKGTGTTPATHSVKDVGPGYSSPEINRNAIDAGKVLEGKPTIVVDPTEGAEINVMFEVPTGK